MKVLLFVEGGGEKNSVRIECRRGFRKLFERAGFAGRMPKIIPCGSRNEVFKDFKTMCQSAGDGEYPMMLVDSEVPVNENHGAWEHLRSADKWQRPDDVQDDQAQLMVQCMETWCVADRDALKRFFKQDLIEGSLPALSNLEGCSKDQIQEALKNATRECGKDRTYKKGRRSFKLVAELNPDVLKKRAPHFLCLCEALEAKLG